MVKWTATSAVFPSLSWANSAAANNRLRAKMWWPHLAASLICRMRKLPANFWGGGRTLTLSRSGSTSWALLTRSARCLSPFVAAFRCRSSSSLTRTGVLARAAWPRWGRFLVLSGCLKSCMVVRRLLYFFLVLEALVSSLRILWCHKDGTEIGLFLILKVASLFRFLTVRIDP